jgi:hypothetical protein
MTPDYRAKLDPRPLVRALFEKSLAGKIKWEPTAREREFLATVGGNTYRVSMQEDRTEYGEVIGEDYAVVEMLNEKGHSMLHITQGDINPAKGEPPPAVPIRVQSLYDLAARIAHGIDERLGKAVESLESL